MQNKTTPHWNPPRKEYKFDNNKYEFLSLLDETISLDEIVPVSFVSHFHALTGRPRKHLFYPILKALLLLLIFSIPTTSLLIVFLKYSQELRDFCGFDTVPNTSIFIRFKQDFLFDLQSIIPLKNKLKTEWIDSIVNEDGIPFCSKMKWEWNSVTKKSNRVCHCGHPCTSSCGKMIYIYPEQNLRAYPGTVRGTQEWDSSYKIYKHQYIRSLKPYLHPNLLKSF